MAEEKKTETSVSEKQLLQMAQQEEAILQNKQIMLERLSAVYRETIIAKEALEEMQKSKGKALVNLGATVLVEVEIKETTKCKRGISENSYKEETIPETIKWLTGREEKLKKQIEKLSQEYNEAEQKLTNMVGILKQIEAEKRKLHEQKRKAPITISK
jgi:prefoldin subunit 5